MNLVFVRFLSNAAVYMPTQLQCLYVPIVDDEVCMKAYPGMISPRMVCAGYMDGGKDACNVSFTKVVLDSNLCTCRRTHHCVSPPFVRVTPAALWCVLENSTAWCHGVRDVPSPTTPASTSRCVSSTAGLKKRWRPTPEERTLFFSFSFSGDSSPLMFPRHKSRLKTQ